MGLRQSTWWVNGHDEVLLLRKEKGRSCEPKSQESCTSHIQSHASLNLRSNVTGCKSWPSLLDAVRWHLNSRLAKSRELKPCSFRVSFRLSQGIKDSENFPKCYIKKTTYLGYAEPNRTEDIIQRGSKQRIQEAEIIKRLGD